MENIANLLEKLNVDAGLIKFCKAQLLTGDDFNKVIRSSDWRLEAKIDVEYEVAYDRLYTGQWSEVPEEHRRWFQVLSCYKAFCIVRNVADEALEKLLKALYILDVGIIVNSGSEEGEVLKNFTQTLHELIGKTFSFMSLQFQAFNFS